MVLCLTRQEVWEKPLIDLGVEVNWVGASPSRLRRLAEIVARLRRSRVDVVQATHGMTNLYAATAGRSIRRPSIGALRTTPDQVLADLGWLGSAALRCPDVLAGNSRGNLEDAVAIGVDPKRVRYLPNAVDLQRFSPEPVTLRTEYGYRSSDPADVSVQAGGCGPAYDVVFVGRLGPEKRVDLLIEAVRLMKDSGRRLRTVIVGAGPLDRHLRAMSERAGLSDLVEFVGNDPTPERWLSQARVLALPSDREGMPNVVLEAMASGLPVVATSVGSIPELVDNGITGWLVPVGDAVSLAEALGRVLADDVGLSSMGSAARLRVESGFDRTAVKAALADIYRGLARGRWQCTG